MLVTTSPAYKCWRCLARAEVTGSHVYRTGVSYASTLPRHERKDFATVHHSSKKHKHVPPQNLPSKGNTAGTQDPSSLAPIRERLRVWEAEDQSSVRQFIKDVGAFGQKNNTLTRPMSVGLVDVEPDVDEADGHQPLFEGDDMVDLRSSASDVEAGDLVELTQDTMRVQLLAVCLGTFNGYQHFYTNNGKWFTSMGLRSLFVVKQFVDIQTVQKVVDALPTTSGSPELLNVLQDLKAGPSRQLGATLLRKMNDFQTEARLVYQSSAAKLDNAYESFVGTERLLTLSEIAGGLLHPGLRVKGKFPSSALYAVHLALIESDGFRPASYVSHTHSYLYTVNSESDMAILEKMEYHVRKFLMSMRSKALVQTTPTDVVLEELGVFGQFILKARKAIDDSRRSRRWSPHGMLALSRSPASPILPGWTTHDLEIIEFMHMWAATQQFSSASKYHSFAAATLRALDRYPDVDYLSEAVGWTFLQELGWIKPWEIQSRYRLRLPGVELERGGGVKAPNQSKNQLGPDLFAGRRKEFDLKCFCIDAESATDIDDGLSLEPTETSGEYWIHVHVADPASRVHPKSTWAAHASVQTQTTYLHGHFARMFGDDVIRENFSLANGKPCLTFSAKVNEDGEILKYDITPAILRDVVYVSPEVVAETCDDEPQSMPGQSETFSVGSSSITTWAPNRKMAEAKDLSTTDVDHLKTLSQLAAKLHSKRLQKGAVPYYAPRPVADVSFDAVEVIKTPDGFMRCNGDPSIHISYGGNGGSMMVASTMQLAGEVAARWCKGRGIPIPFRIQPRAAANEKLLEAFAEAHYPKLRAGQPLSSEEWRTFMLLSGGTDMSTHPAPNFAMGIDLYTKATSPLRRYADLLVHWQIEATLLQEQLLGHKVQPHQDLSFLPFSRAMLEEQVLPVLRVRERHAKMLDRSQGNREWMLQALVRAWKFGESADLPPTFCFTVRAVLLKSLIKGTLNWFDMDALLEPSGIADLQQDGKHIGMADAKVGDVYEVELDDVNVHSGRIRVKALRRIEEAQA